MVLAGLVVPWLGALSDRTGKTKTYLIGTTILCVVFTLLLSVFTTVPLLIVGFLLACFFYHASLVFYCALLPVVAEPEDQGFVSGLGTALGYLGVLFAIPIAHVVDSLFHRRFVFLEAGVLFLIFSLPLFFLVPERKVINPVSVSVSLLIEEWKKVFNTVSSLKKNKPLLFFFLGNFLCLEAINTMIFWLAVYAAKVFNPTQTFLVALLLGINFGAFLSGLLAGFLTQRIGAQKTLLGAASCLFATVVILGLTKNLWIFLGFGLTTGAFSLAGMWTSGRKRVVELVPEKEVGEYFGLYNLTTKISVTGSLVFSILADQWGFQVALLSLALPSGLGLYFLRAHDN